MDKEIFIEDNNQNSDQNFYQKKIFRMFPYLQNKSKLMQLKIDQESTHFISFRDHADKITQIIKQHVKKINCYCRDLIITDCTAGVGGNTLSFGHYFKFVNAIEIVKIRCQYLQNNIDVYDLKNIKIFNEDCTKILDKLEHNIIFVDAPWGLDYKKFKNLRLNFGNQQLENFCIDLMNPNIMKKIPELIVLKLPKNYDVLYFYKIISSKNRQIYYYDLKKMIILVILIYDHQF
ncbi:mRNA capping enzyme [uncultured virus]|nr:mRNA capping enzyme [uncultured virus]